MGSFPEIRLIEIQGYRVFGSFSAELGPLTALVGANGSGKTCLFEFLEFLRMTSMDPIPPEIGAGSAGRQVFHNPDAKAISWNIRLQGGKVEPLWDLSYSAKIEGGYGSTVVAAENLYNSKTDKIIENRTIGALAAALGVKQPSLDNNALALSKPDLFTSPEAKMLRDYLSRWRFYSANELNPRDMAKPSVLQQNAYPREDGNNLSSVLHFLVNEHPSIFEEIVLLVKLVLPGFRGLTVPARGGPGEVLACIREEGVDSTLSLADLSDGTLRLLFWACLCLHPLGYPLICIDEPEVGMHPRVLPVLAGLLTKLSEKSQVIIATHNSYFLRQFGLEEIAVMRKENGEAKFYRAADSPTLKSLLEEFGDDDIESLHITDELEALI